VTESSFDKQNAEAFAGRLLTALNDWYAVKREMLF
jgi:hypothetical protein